MTAPARILAIALVVIAVQAPAAWAQPVVPVPAQQESGAFSAAELDQMLAPIALYPDVLLSTILIASTYPLEIVQAARWSRNNPQLSGEAAVAATEGQDWDPAVRALVAFPEILHRLDEDLDWTQALGDAFLYQEAQVMDSVQYLRQRASDAGTLQTDENVRVVRSERTVVIEPVRERIVYVPWYDTRVVYGPWWRPAHPPVYWHAPHWHAPVHFRPRHSGIYWSSGFAVSSGFFFSTVHWPQRHVLVLHRPHHFYAPHRRPHAQVHHHHYHAYTPGKRWQHTPHHRRGVAYRHPEVHRRYQPEHREPRREGRHSYQPHQPEQRREGGHSHQPREQERRHAGRGSHQPREREQRQQGWRQGDQPAHRDGRAAGAGQERLTSGAPGYSGRQGEARSRYLEGVPRLGGGSDRAGGARQERTGTTSPRTPRISAPAQASSDSSRSALLGTTRERGRAGGSPAMGTPATRAPAAATRAAAPPHGNHRSSAPSGSARSSALPAQRAASPAPRVTASQPRSSAPPTSSGAVPAATAPRSGGRIAGSARGSQDNARGAPTAPGEPAARSSRGGRGETGRGSERSPR